MIDECAAVLEVITRETDAFLSQDFETWATCWVQDRRTREICVSSSLGATVHEGWDNLSNYMREVIEGGAVCAISEVQRSNINTTIRGDMAHVVFDGFSKGVDGRVEKTFETRVLERTNGVWRILYASFVLHGHQSTDRLRLAVDANGKVLCAPEDALAYVRTHPGLTVSNNRLRGTKPAWDKILKAGLKLAAEQHGYFQHYRYLTESGQMFRLPIVFGETDDGGVAVCVIFVRDGQTFVETQNEVEIDNRLKAAKSVFGLSEKQVLLAHHIVSGQSLKTASAELGISVNTARTQLARIYLKTGVNSQTALVRSLICVG